MAIRQFRQYRQVFVAMVLLCSVFAGGVAAVSAASGSNGKGDTPIPGKGDAPRGGPSSPAAAYTLQGDTSNSGTDSTSFTSSDTAWGNVGAWRFYASGAGETALRAYCYGAGSTCWGFYVEGQQHGVYAQSDNGTGTSIAVHGISYGQGGQGIGGENGQAGGYGGVFTATGSSGIGLKARSTSYYGLAAYSNESTSIYALSGVYGVTNPTYSILGDTYLGSTTEGLAAYADRGHGAFAQTYGGNSTVGGSNPLTAGLYAGNLMANGGSPQLNAGVVGTCNTCAGVFGLTDSYIGVRGLATGGANSYGGYFTATQGIALYGKSVSGVGVYGTSSTNSAVYGSSTSGAGTYGHSVSSFGAYGFSGSGYGLAGGSTSGFGIRAASTSNYGLYVTTDTGPAGQYVKITNGVVGLRAINSTPAVAGHYSIIGEGNAYIVGTLHATGGVVLVAPTNQGDKQVYGGAATQNLLTDAGTAKLVNGRAVIKIDPLFAQTVNLSDGYRVFVTPNSADTLGLGIINKSTSTFEVRELNKGSGNFSFDWKIEAVRKGYEAERMGDAPTLPADPNVDAPTLKPLPADNVEAPALNNTAPPATPHKAGITASGAPVKAPGRK